MSVSLDEWLPADLIFVSLTEKTIAAKRSGVTNIIFPASNKNDWDELPDYIREGVNGIPVESYEDIFGIVFEKAGSSSKPKTGGSEDKVIDVKFDKKMEVQTPLGG